MNRVSDLTTKPLFFEKILLKPNLESNKVTKRLLTLRALGLGINWDLDSGLSISYNLKLKSSHNFRIVSQQIYSNFFHGWDTPTPPLIQ